MKRGFAKNPGLDSPTGRHVESKAVQIGRVVDGTVRSNRHYLDIATLLAQLGLMPAAG